MEQNTPKFRLRLNLFDSIVLILALAVGAFLLWNALKPDPAAKGPSSETSTVRYTVRFQKWKPGDSALIQLGDKLTDNIKNLELGKVVAVQAVPSQTVLLDEDSRAFVLATIQGYEDVLVTVESPAAMAKDAVVLGDGYRLWVGATAYIRGSGYMATSSVISIEREGTR